MAIFGKFPGSGGNKRIVWLESGGGEEGGRFYSKADGMLLSLSRLQHLPPNFMDI